MFDSILSFLETSPDWVNWTIFTLIFIESLFIAGLFTPALLIVPGIGALAARVGISPFEITFYATMGMIVGDSVSYGLGRLVGNGCPKIIMAMLNKLKNLWVNTGF